MKVERVLLVGAFRRIVPEGDDGPFGSQGGFVDTLAPAPYSLANAKLKLFAETDPAIAARYQIDLLDLAEPLEIDDVREEVAFTAADLDRILGQEPDIVGFSTYCWNIDAIRELVPELKRRRPGVVVLLGGRGVEGDSAQLLAQSPTVDALLLGEAELAFREVLHRGARKLAGIPGVVCRGEDGQITSGGPAQSLDRLDDIPSPYLQGALSPPQHGVMLELSRGCLHACGYCSWNADKRLRYYGAERIESEVRWARNASHRHITITDSAINYDTGRLRGFIDAVRRADPDGVLRFTYNVRTDSITDEQLRLLAMLPTHTLLLGVETLAPKPMGLVGRAAVDRSQLRETLIAIGRAVGPPVVSIVLGLPGDTEAGFKETLDTLLEWTREQDGQPPAVGTVLVSLLQVYRGSKLWEAHRQLELSFQQRGIPYLLASPDWPAAALARAKADLVRLMRYHPERLKAAEAIVMMERRGGLRARFAHRTIDELLADWPRGSVHEGWTFERVGLMRDTGQAMLLRFSWHQGGEARVRLSAIENGEQHAKGLRYYQIAVDHSRRNAPPRRALERLKRLVCAVVRRGERRLTTRALEAKRELLRR